MHKNYTPSIGRLIFLPALISVVLLLAGCTVSREIRLGEQAIDRGELAQGLDRLQKNAKRHPDHARAQTAYYLNRDAVLSRLNVTAEQARDKEDFTAALRTYQDILAVDPLNDRAAQGLREIERRQHHVEWRAQAKLALESGQNAQAERWLSEILSENRNDSWARNQLMEIRSRAQREARLPLTLKKSFSKPVSLELRQVPLQSVLELLSESSGLSFILDAGVRGDERATLFAKNTTVEDSLNLLMATNNLAYKTLNDSTLLIYPATAEKRRKYGDLVIKTFLISNGNAKSFSEMIKSFVKSAEVFADEKAKTLVVRDTQDNINVIEKLLAANDVPDAEVVLEIEILEINTDKLANIGIQYPTQAKGSVTGSNNVAGVIPLPEFSNLNKSNFLVNLGDPLAIVNLKYTDGIANTLANPRIRVRNHEKAKVMIGDKVPVITTSNNATSGTISESVSYLDVGLKLEVEPDVHLDNEVSMDVTLEVSDIVKEVTSSTGLTTYQIGTRNATTSLRLRDGETQALAGLIRREEKESASRIPGLGNLPILGYLFSNESRTRKRSELVLLITPHIVRSRALPEITTSEILVGSDENPGMVLRLRNGARYANRGNNGTLGSKVVESGKAARAASAANPSGTAADPLLAIPVANPSAEGTPAASATPELVPAEVNDEAGGGELAPTVMFDPSLAKIRLNLVAPGQVKAGQEFTLAIMANSTESFRVLEMQLDLPAEMELTRTTAAAGIEIKSHLKDKSLTLHASSAQPRLVNGPLALITLRAKTAANNGLLTARIQKAVGPEEQEIMVYAGEPRTLAVLP